MVDNIPGLSIKTRNTQSWSPAAARTRARLRNKLIHNLGCVLVLAFLLFMQPLLHVMCIRNYYKKQQQHYTESTVATCMQCLESQQANGLVAGLSIGS